MQQKSGCGRTLLLLIFGLLCLGVLLGIYLQDAYQGMQPRPLPAFPTTPPYTAWPTPPPALAFDFPLLPAEHYAPYVQGISGPLAVDTRYGAQNPAQGNRANCFRDVNERPVPFSQLYHAGVDLFGVDDAGQVVWGQAKHAPVYAVADGVTVFTLNAGSEGHIVGLEHRLTGGSAVYSIYWHVSHVQVEAGQPVARGRMIAVVHDLGANSHLHWEMRTFYDGSDLFPAGSAGARGTCNRQIPGVGYTWDDTPARAHPDYYGYLDPTAFVESRR